MNIKSSSAASKSADEFADNPASSIRRWSRNLRYRELDRLNQVERRRQLSELREQNDLFEQMLATVNGPSNASNGHQGDEEPAGGQPRDQMIISARALAKEGQAGQSELARPLLAGPDRTEGELPMTYLSSPEDKGEGCARAAELEGARLEACKRATRASAQKQPDEPDIPPKVAVHTIQNEPEQQQMVKPTRRQMSTDELIKFVTTRVPDNKRVLCLIVRDKFARLNKAKSYFYPTYYLLVQAIVDAEDSPLALGAGASSEQDQLGGGSAGGVVGQQTSAASSTSSSENSFSASSSISADMLFIGAESAIRSSASLSKLTSVGPTGTSYSDYEAHGQSETEDEGEVELALGRLAGAGHSEALVSSGEAEEATGRVELNERALSGKASGEQQQVHKSQLHGAAKGGGQAAMSRNGGKRGAEVTEGLSEAPLGDEGMRFDVDCSDSDNDKRKQRAAGAKWSRQADYGGREEAEGGRQDEKRGHHDKRDTRSREESVEVNLFDNEQNPYTGASGVLLAGRRRRKTKTYLIGPNEYGFSRKNSICKLKSNVLGTQFNAIRLPSDDDDGGGGGGGIDRTGGNNDRCTIAAISYETNVLGFKGPRKMRVYLPKDQRGEFRNLPETFKRNPAAVVQLRNMTPSWNVESQSYVLNFHGRVTQASVKNFQLIECSNNPAEGQRNQNSTGGARQLSSDAHGYTHDLQTSKEEKIASNLLLTEGQAIKTSQDSNGCKRHPTRQMPVLAKSLSSANSDKETLFEDGKCGFNTASLDKSHLPMDNKSLSYTGSIVMQFGRISSHEFTCDVAHPLSILQAFSIALSSFDSKLACE